MELGPDARPIGELLGPILDRIGFTGPVQVARCPPLPAADVFPAWTPPLLSAMRHAAFDAKDRGASVVLTTRGLLVRKHGKCELVPWQDVELIGIMDRALNRVAPHEWESD